MRAKLWAIAIAMLILAGISVVEQIGTRQVTCAALEQTAAILAEIRADKLDAAIEKAHALDGTWDEQAKLLEVLVDHGSTDDVRYALSRLIAALEGGDRASAMIYAGELEGAVEHVVERQALTLENLF